MTESKEPVYTPDGGAAEGQFIVDVLDVHIGERYRKEMGNVDNLATDLNENGQLQPILIRPPFEGEEISGKWVLVAGGRRMAAAMKLGWFQMAAYVREDIDTPVAHLVAELHENIKRHDMSWQEQADMKRAILALRKEQDPTITAKEVALEIGDNASSFSRDVDVAEAMEKAPELRKSSSRKSALRARDVAAQLEARIAADERNKAAITAVADRVLTAEALDFLQQYDGFFDLCVTDPPYGIEYFKQGQKDNAGADTLSGYDDSFEATQLLYRHTFPALARAMRETGWVLMFGSAESVGTMREMWLRTCKIHYGFKVDAEDERGHRQHCDCSFDDSEKCEYYRPEIIPWIWVRPNSRNRPRFPERTAQNCYEYILVVNMGAALLAKPTQNVFVHDAVYDETRVHVNQKPIELIQDLLDHIGYPGDRFVDPFHGSGAHLAAAASRSMLVHGCDSNPAVHDVALGMIAKHYKEAPPSVRDLSEARFKQRLAALTFDAQAPKGEVDDDLDSIGLVDDDGLEEEGVFERA